MHRLCAVFRREQGFATPLLAFGMMVLVFAGSALFVTLHGALATRDRLTVQLQSAAVLAADQVNPQGLAQGEAQIDPSAAAAAFATAWPQMSGLPASDYTVTAFQIYTVDQAGQPAPSDVGGAIPGASVYVQVTISAQYFGLPVGDIRIAALGSPNRFNSPGNYWHGG